MPHPTSFTFVRDLDGPRQKIWRLNHPFTLSLPILSGADALELKRDADGNIIYEDVTFQHVVSSICLPLCSAIQGGPECYIFPALENGEIRSWTELPGSSKHTTDHELVMSAFINSFLIG